MNEYINLGDLGRFQGFLACIIGAAFVIAGPEYISMCAGEAKNPRKSMPKAFNSITYRLVGFFIIGALSVGIVCPYTSDQLLGNAGAYAAASPYIISMEILRIKIFPSIVNALILTSILSAANGYVFSRSSRICLDDEWKILTFHYNSYLEITLVTRNGWTSTSIPCQTQPKWCSVHLRYHRFGRYMLVVLVRFRWNC